MNIDVRAPNPESFSSRMADLVITAPTISTDTPCGKVFSMLVEDGALPCLAVIDGGGVIRGMVSRAAYTAIMAKPLMGDLYAKRPVEAIMRTDPLVVDAGESIEAAAEQLTKANPEAMVEGFLVARDGRYLGVGSAQDLLARSAANARRAAEEIKLKSERIAALLDHSGQGFLSVGLDLLVDRDYSRACVAILDCEPAHKDISVLMFPDDPQKVALIHRAITKVFDETDDLRREMFLSLLPTRLTRAGRVIDVEYVLISRERMMLILSDVTDKIALEETIERERRKLEMVVSAVADSRELFDAIGEFKSFIAQMDEITRPELSPLLDPDSLYRDIHTFKGTFAQFGFFDLSRELHALEERISAIRDGEDDDRKVRTRLFEAFFEVKLALALKRDLRVLADVFGDDFLGGEGVVQIPVRLSRKVQALADAILRDGPAAIQSEDARAVLRAVSDLGRISLRQALEGYGPLLNKLAARLGKELQPFLVSGPDVLLDPGRHGPFLRTLGHIFRNAVAHGIETPDERAEAGKAEAGAIRCDIQVSDTEIRFDIADDGRGLDVARLAAKAEAGLSREQTLELIFRDGLTTSDEATDISGRGVGLAAVRAAAAELGGQVHVSSRDGLGTTFHIQVPRG